MSEPYRPARQSWLCKFTTAFRGCWRGMHGHNSFLIHLPAAVLVLAAAGYWEVTRGEWCVLVLAIALVIAAELLNSSVEALAKAVTQVEDPHVALALDIASGAVLFAAGGAAVVGALVFLPYWLPGLLG
jgi:diacylglycerol kinase